MWGLRIPSSSLLDCSGRACRVKGACGVAARSTSLALRAGTTVLEIGSYEEDGDGP